jgi:hypothetical protein
MNEPEKLIPLHGRYRKLKSFQVAQPAYDVTARFGSARTSDIFALPKRRHVAALHGAGGATGRAQRSRPRRRVRAPSRCAFAELAAGAERRPAGRQNPSPLRTAATEDGQAGRLRYGN